MKTVLVELPAELFGEDATVERVYPLKMKRVREVAELQSTASGFDELVSVIASIFPRWRGVLDPESGKVLANPEDGADVLFELETEPFRWFGGKGLTQRPM